MRSRGNARDIYDLNPHLTSLELEVLEEMLEILEESLVEEQSVFRIAAPQEVQQHLVEVASRVLDAADVIDFVYEFLTRSAREDAGEWYYRGGSAVDVTRQFVIDFFRPEVPPGFDFLLEWHDDLVDTPLSPICRCVLVNKAQL